MIRVSPTTYYGVVIKRGEAFCRKFEAPFSLDGAEIRMQLVEDLYGEDGEPEYELFYTFSVGDGITIEPEGRFILEISDALTSRMSFEGGRYAVFVSLPDGQVIKLLRGCIRIFDT